MDFKDGQLELMNNDAKLVKKSMSSTMSTL